MWVVMIPGEYAPWTQGWYRTRTMARFIAWLVGQDAYVITEEEFHAGT